MISIRMSGKRDFSYVFSYQYSHVFEKYALAKNSPTYKKRADISSLLLFSYLIPGSEISLSKLLEDFDPFRFFKADQYKVLTNGDGALHQHTVGGQQIQLFLFAHGGQLVL